MNIKFDPYSIYARIFPTIITSIPFLFFQYFYLSPELNKFLTNLITIQWVGHITLSVAAIYFLSQLNRTIGKDIFEQWYFSDEGKLPTTNLLLQSNGYYSDEFKNKIWQKIKLDFDLDLSTSNSHFSEHAQRQKVVEAVGLIRRKVGSGTLLMQHLIEYGFARNLIGGSVISFIVSVVCAALFYGNSPSLFKTSIVLSLGYLLVVLFSYPILHRKGKLYAKILFQEYLLLRNTKK